MNANDSKGLFPGQAAYICNGNEAVARAILDIGYDGEGYFPITPSSEAGEEVSKAVAAGNADVSFVAATSELAAIGVCMGMSVAGGRCVDVTSAQGFLLKVEQLPAISSLGLPMVMNLSTREVNAPLNIKNGHSDWGTALGLGWLMFQAPNVQAAYDMNIIALKVAEAVNLPAIVAYDGFHTSHANRRIVVFKELSAVQKFLGERPPKRPTVLDFDDPRTFGPYMNDDLINIRHLHEERMSRAVEVIPKVFKEYGELTGRHYSAVEVYGDRNAELGIFILNSAAEVTKDVVDDFVGAGTPVKMVSPYVVRPWPEKEIIEAVGGMKRLLVAERVSQYGTNNYMVSDIATSLYKAGRTGTKLISRVYGIGGINYYEEDARAFLDTVVGWEALPAGQKVEAKQFHGSWPGDPSHAPAERYKPLPGSAFSFNQGETRVDLKKLAAVPHRISKHSACPGCGIFANIDLFLKGIDGQVIMLFNTGCGMVVTTGFPDTSFKVPYVHNLFHNASSTATGIVEMFHRFRAKGYLNEEVTVIAVSGDGGDDIGMDQVLAAALRDDPFIMLEYDNKGYMNTGFQLCYTGLLGQRASNAPVGKAKVGKQTQHKDMTEILRGAYSKYLFQAAESNALDAIRKARKAQQMVRQGHFVFGKFFSVCPLNWGTDEKNGNAIVKTAVDTCVHPLFEVENGVTTVNYNPEKLNKKLPVTELLKAMGNATRHLLKPENAAMVEQMQTEVDRRWRRLTAMADSPVL